MSTMTGHQYATPEWITRRMYNGQPRQCLSGRWIRNRRIELGIGFAEAWREIGITSTMMHYVEKGERYSLKVEEWALRRLVCAEQQGGRSG